MSLYTYTHATFRMALSSILLTMLPGFFGSVSIESALVVAFLCV